MLREMMKVKMGMMMLMLSHRQLLVRWVSTTEQFSLLSSQPLLWRLGKGK